MLVKLDGAVGIARLAGDLAQSEFDLTSAFTHLGVVLGIDWLQAPGRAAQPDRSVGASARLRQCARAPADAPHLPGAGQIQAGAGLSDALDRPSWPGDHPIPPADRARTGRSGAIGGDDRGIDRPGTGAARAVTLNAPPTTPFVLSLVEGRIHSLPQEKDSASTSSSTNGFEI